VHLYNNFYEGSIASVPNRKWGNGMAVAYEGDVLAQSNFFHVLGLKINANNEICGKLVHHHGSATGFRGENLWFGSDDVTALVPLQVDTHLAGCSGLPISSWQPPYSYTPVSDPVQLGNTIPSSAGAGRLQ
jgi:pectate lyase